MRTLVRCVGGSLGGFLKEVTFEEQEEVENSMGRE